MAIDGDVDIGIGDRVIVCANMCVVYRVNIDDDEVWTRRISGRRTYNLNGGGGS